jgi:phosphatidylinositol alpha-1,6-mannosyltransferase
MAEVADSRPRALLVTRNFPPLVGGMERVNLHLLTELSRGWRVSLCGPSGCAHLVKEATAVAETPLKPLPRFLLGCAWRALRLARRERPELVIAGSGLSAPMAWLAARVCGARLAVYLHGLDIIAPSMIYQRLWLPFIRACDVVLVNSENTGRLAREHGVVAGKISILHPGTDTPDLDPEAGPAFRTKLGLEQRLLLLSVGRFTRRKGLFEFVMHALPAIAEVHPHVLLLIIGEEASDALHGASGSERERIQDAAREVGVEGNLRFLGRCDEATLHAAYQAADCHVFPVLDLPGDVEGFGMVALESAAHGLQTIAFAVGGVPDAVAEGSTGRLVRPGDYAGFAQSVLAIIAAPAKEEQRLACRQFAEGKCWARFGEQLRSICHHD